MIFYRRTNYLLRFLVNSDEMQSGRCDTLGTALGAAAGLAIAQFGADVKRMHVN